MEDELEGRDRVSKILANQLIRSGASVGGKIEDEQADDYARHEYENFEAKQREYIETQAEEEYIKNLEQAAKQLHDKNTGGEV
ncbi:MAG: hypothetical protein ACOCSE_00585 [Chitinivibrionales bacterium]